MATLRITGGPAAGETREVASEVVIGREGADLVIGDTEISRRHASVAPTDGGVVVTDLGSTNGTFVDGRRIEGSVTLTTDATLRIGQSEIALEVSRSGATRMHARSPAAAAAPAPAAAAPPPAAAPPATAPAEAAPPTEEVPAASDGGPPPAERLKRGGLLVPIIAIPVAIIVAILVITNINQASKSNHTLTSSLRTSVLSGTPGLLTLAGSQVGKPDKAGDVFIDQSFVLPPGKTTPQGVSQKLTSRFDDGTFTSVVAAKATQQKDGSLRLAGTGKIVGGTRKYKDATGSFTLAGTLPPQPKPGAPLPATPANALFTINGNIKY